MDRVVAQSTYAYQPDHAAAPGDLIQEYLETLDISGRELARRCGRSPKLIAEIISGKAPVEPETALQLERVLEVSASIWMGMEGSYRLQLARAKESPALAEYASWAKKFPLKDLSARGLLKLSANAAEQVTEVLKFFGCGNVDACEERFTELSAAAFRHSPSFDSDQASLLAWLRIGDVKAEEVDAEDYDRATFISALKQIRDLAIEPQATVFLPKIQELCAEAGVIFLLERALPKVSLSGVSRWISPRRALIQQTARYLSDDHFWFTFFHECAHILLHSRKSIFLDGKGLTHVAAELEAEANDWAADFLIPSEEMTKFISRFTYTQSEVVSFAKKHRVSPGIVVGQLQHRKVLPYSSKMNNLRQRYVWTD